MPDFVRVIPLHYVGREGNLGFSGIAEAAFGFPELIDPAVIIPCCGAGVRFMSREIGADGGNVVQCVAAAVIEAYS